MTVAPVVKTVHINLIPAEPRQRKVLSRKLSRGKYGTIMEVELSEEALYTRLSIREVELSGLAHRFAFQIEKGLTD
jgi:hypothetical protein